MKVKTIIGAVFVIGLISFYLIHSWLSVPPLITGAKADVESIVFTTFMEGPGRPGPIEIRDELVISRIYDQLRGTETMIKRHPSHEDRVQVDTEIEAVFNYFNGDYETVIFSLAGLVIRMLDTQGPDGDYGYVWGINEDLYRSLVYMGF